MTTTDFVRLHPVWTPPAERPDARFDVVLKDGTASAVSAIAPGAVAGAAVTLTREDVASPERLRAAVERLTDGAPPRRSGLHELNEALDIISGSLSESEPFADGVAIAVSSSLLWEALNTDDRARKLLAAGRLGSDLVELVLAYAVPRSPIAAAVAPVLHGLCILVKQGDAVKRTMLQNAL